MVYSIGKFLCRIWIYLAFRIHIEGKEHVPADKGYILIANHRTNADPLFLAVPVRPQVYYMAKAELFKNGFLKWLMHHLGAFPVERGKGDTGAIDWAKEIIRKGGVLGMFPEGTRSPDGKPLRPKSGVAMIAGQTHADVVPCGISFEGKLGFRTKVTIRYGAPISYEQMGFDGGEIKPHQMKEASRILMDHIIALLDKAQ